MAFMYGVLGLIFGYANFTVFFLLFNMMFWNKIDPHECVAARLRSNQDKDGALLILVNKNLQNLNLVIIL